MMRHFDADYAREVIARLKVIPEDAVPRWGQLRRDTLIEHLIWAIMHSMGRSRQVPFFGNWFTVHILAPIFLTGWFAFPRNIKLPKNIAAQGATMREPGNMDTLAALLEEYLTLVQADELTPAPHNVFGDIGVAGRRR